MRYKPPSCLSHSPRFIKINNKEEKTFPGESQEYRSAPQQDLRVLVMLVIIKPFSPHYQTDVNND